MAITPRFRSSGVSCSSVLSAPRSLNEAVNCRFSNLTQMSALAMRDSVSLLQAGRVHHGAADARGGALHVLQGDGQRGHHAARRRSIQSRVRYQAPIMGRNHGSPL